jgi:hypothetical protein
MNINQIELSGIIYIFSFIVSLVGLLIVYGIVKRTKDKMRYGLIYVLLGIAVFVLLKAFEIFEVFQIVGQTIITDLLEILFIFLLVAGMWKLRTLIKGLSDYGQAFVLTSKEKYEDNLVSIVKNVRGVCYVTTEQPYKKIVDLFSLYGIDTSTMQFIDATGGEGDAENVITIKNTPDDIKTTLDKVLKEKNINVVVIDNVSAVKLTKKFELPRFVQDMTLLIKANRSQGFFIGKTEDLGVQTMNDIAMFVDKVTGDVKW